MTKVLIDFLSGLKITDVLITLLTGGLLWVANRQRDIYARQASLMETQTKLLHTQFIATHRPKLRVRNFVIDTKDTGGERRRIFDGSGFVRGQFTVANIGGSQAIIVERFCQVYVSSSDLPMRRPYDGREPLEHDRVSMPIAAGHSFTDVFRAGFKTLVRRGWCDS